jgi:hypothetical protein
MSGEKLNDEVKISENVEWTVHGDGRKVDGSSQPVMPLSHFAKGFVA